MDDFDDRIFYYFLNYNKSHFIFQMMENLKKVVLLQNFNVYKDNIPRLGKFHRLLLTIFHVIQYNDVSSTRSICSITSQ
jgi:hypothetical protein